jgi:Cu2+-exporting ATPase
MDCVHCGLPAPDGVRFCCHGCEAVWGALRGLGLPALPAFAPQPEEALLDDAASLARFTRREPDGTLEVELLIEGMRCAACAWLAGQAMLRVRGVREASVTFATRRARVRWDPATRLAAIVAAIRSVGYRAWPYAPGRIAMVEARERRTALRRLWVAGLGMMQVMMYAVPTYIAGEGEITADIESLMRWAGLLLTLPVVLYSAAPFFRGAARELSHARPGMDLPVALGILIAFAASAWATVAGHGAVYFDSVTMFVFLLLGGRYLELIARSRAGAALQHLARVEAASAERLSGPSRHDTEIVPLARLVPGDRVLVRTGESVPADGELEGPASEVNEAWLSGESRALARRPGESLTGGSVNAGRAFVMRVTRVGVDTAASSIRRLMERALEERPPWVAASERAGGIFVLAVLACAAAGAAAWWPSDPGRAVWIAVSILVVTCPCALALATPVTLVAASGALARRHFIVTRGGAIERLAAATDIVFDKTGTLTQGRPRVLSVESLSGCRPEDARSLAAALARASSHPLDRAIADCSDVPVRDAASHRNVPGEGVEAEVAGRRIRLGRAAFVAGLHGRRVPPHVASDATRVWLGDEAGWIATFRLGDAVRPEARQALEALRASGLRLHLLSGDGAGPVAAVAAQLGIALATAEATPQEKIEYVRALQQRGARVAMVGDGVNDAPVLAQADVSVAMGGGADLAQLRADAVLLSDDLADLARAGAIARRARSIVRQNLAWALGYNAIVIPVALAGWVTPLAAGLAMASSSLLVVANALRVSR